MDTPYSVVVLEEVPSTQDIAREKATVGRPAVVIAHRQRRGRGRSGAEWISAPRAIAVSVGFIPRWPPEAWTRIPLVGGVAARRVLGDAVVLKWPNDILVSDSKVGGILVEASGTTVVAGMGLNVHWPTPPEGVAGLFEVDPGPQMGPLLAERWAKELLTLVADPPDRWPRGEYVAACTTIGQDIQWEPNGAGRAVGIGPDGSLAVATPGGGVVQLRSGEVRHVRRSGNSDA